MDSQKVIELLESLLDGWQEKYWCKFAVRRNKSVCLVGRITAVIPSEHIEEVTNELCRTIGLPFNSTLEKKFVALGEWNDADSRSFEHIEKLVQKTIKRLGVDTDDSSQHSKPA